MALAAMLTPLMIPVVGCSDLEDDDHYGDSTTKIDNQELTIVKSTSEEYLKGRTSLQKMDALFEKYGIYDELEAKGQLSTILVVENENYDDLQGDEDDIRFAVRSHVSDMSVSPANLHDGDRLMMWHGKYTNITMDEEGKEGHIIDHVYFNNGVVKEVIQTSNGYIYVISDMIETPTSLSDFINGLGDEYSIFKELVLASGGKEFDRANSKPIGVSPEGNTLYDSVFIYTNAHFEAVDFDMNSESLTATMLLPSDEVINAAMADAHNRLQQWGLERSDSAIKNWILDVAFYNKRLTRERLVTPSASDDPGANDIKSIFSKQWRPGAHEVVAADPIELSNGIVYNLAKIHIPTNVLIYRLKDYFYHYESCTDEQKASFFKMWNMTYSKCNEEVGYWTPWETVWPPVRNYCLLLAPDKETFGDDAAAEAYQLDFTPVMAKADNSIVAYKIPPGAYRLAFGSKQNQGIPFRIHVLVDNKVVASSTTFTSGSATTFHYDRNNNNTGYPEGYDQSYVKTNGGTNKGKAGNYDTDGGIVIEEVVIPDVYGDGTAVPIVIRIEGDNWAGKSTHTLHHWCLRPTVNNY